MTHLNYSIVNVFAESPWGGNPLVIAPDADDLSTETMQLIALQFNLSETVFICASDTAVAHLRIFTPDFEMPFAGHPTIGAAAWLYEHRGLGDNFTLQTNAKTVQIQHDNGVFRFTLSGYEQQKPRLSRDELAAGLGLNASDMGENPMWMNAGTWQLGIRHKSAIQPVKLCINHGASHIRALILNCRFATTFSRRCSSAIGLT